MPLYPQSVASQGECLNSLLFRCFHLILTFESIKELGIALGKINNFKVLNFLFMNISYPKFQNTIIIKNLI